MDCPKRTEAAVGLPDDPLVEILSRVPVKSLCRFKCVSKAWGHLIADPLHRKKLPQTLQGFFFFTGLDDGEHGTGTDDGSHDGEEPEPSRQLYGFFDVLQRRVRSEDFSYLLSELLPGPPAVLEETRLLHSCNGLLLFAVHYSGGCNISESYVVCNPATKQCVAVPSCGFTREQMRFSRSFTYLLFNPGVRCEFSLVQVSVGRDKTSVHVYSSKTQAWSHNKSHWGCYDVYSPGVYVNGMLHLLMCFGKDQINVVDVEGNLQKVIPAPRLVGRDIWPKTGFIGQSQGFLYYFCYELEIICDAFSRQISGRLLIWVLEDYDRQHWVLKDDVSFLKLFGERNNPMDTNNYNVVGIHPDHSLVFLVKHWDQKLISYNIDTKEVCHLCTLGQGCKGITPYVPYFSAFGASK